MRLKFKPWANDYINLNRDFFITDEKRLNSLRGEYKEIWFEIGAGKGRFSCELAKRNKDVLVVAIERYESVIVMGAKQLEDEYISNLKFMPLDMTGILEFDSIVGNVDRIFLNFSDPWPKSRHAKRRLTHENFLLGYDKLLKDSGFIEFKTDNQGLFESSLISLSNVGFKILEISLDLHNTDRDNIMTEYEEKFSKKGFTIKYLKTKKG